MKAKEMEKKAREALKERLDVIYDTYFVNGAVGVVGKIGGDIIHFRVHFEDGKISSITEK